MTSDPIAIHDADDPRIAAYREIRERDLVGRENRFIAEGKVVLNVLFSARRFAPESVLILENRLAGMQETLRHAPADMPVYVATQAVMDRIVGFHIHRGILALGRKRGPENIAAMLDSMPADALVLVLVGISNHDNVGAIFRNAAAFGADAVLLDPTSCDPLYRKAIRVSVGATLKVPYAVALEEEMLFDALGRAGFSRIALSPAGREDIAQIRPDGRTALFLGTEGEGLPPELMARMRTARIEMANDFDSLNVATASAIALHRLWRGGG
ncbi:RNA methyltransferase [Aquamicrobium sp. LC103]|uniref:TrmH family RNA methyltransferase n=1 Tax=Aquamicrobium sp. LC103 TaxID=1120658 RepID=UPI00063E9714|nr:RNA methyltransferase [Aquamicrobium sp. LC103]TKT77393.1 RNA methyltransferase [Aquamicrobium sp. LC103]